MYSKTCMPAVLKGVRANWATILSNSQHDDNMMMCLSVSVSSDVTR